MSDYVFDIPQGCGPTAPHLTSDGHIFSLEGHTVMAMPPGPVNIHTRQSPPILNILPYGGSRLHEFRYNGVDLLPRSPTGSQSIFYGGGDIELVCENPNWECLIEFEPDHLAGIAAERFDGTVPISDEIAFQRDPALSMLAHMTIEHLRSGPSDPLYVEGLAIAMTARTFANARNDVRNISANGTLTRIRRTIDYAEAHLDRSLSVAELAGVAAMSPSWFAQCFRVETGQPVHAFVRARRLERARTLLIDRRLSIQQVADACGFADLAHLTRAFKQRFGTTPGAMRER